MNGGMVNDGTVGSDSVTGDLVNGGTGCDCEVCGDAPASCTVMTDDGDLELCAGCAEVVGDSEGWRPSASSPDSDPSDDQDTSASASPASAADC